MKHKHEKWIHLMADGVRIETAVNGEWIGAYWGDFNDNNLTFRIAPNQPADIAKQEKVVLYQWIIYINSAKHPVLTSFFYPDEAALQYVYQKNLKIVQRAEWTRIEVEK